MADLKQAIQYAAQNPTSEFAQFLGKRITSGQADAEAQALGIDITSLKQNLSAQPTKTESPKKDATSGIGYSPTVTSKKDDSITRSVVKTASNVPKSGLEFGKSIVSAVTHPKRTVEALGKTAMGIGAKTGEKFLEETGIGQKVMNKVDELRKQQGLEPLKRDTEGKLQVEETPELEFINQVGTYLSDRYGSLENIKKTAVEDPIGFIADVAGLVTGTGAAVRTVGTASKLSTVASVGSRIAQTGSKLEPISAVVSKIPKVAKATVGILSEVLPIKKMGERSLNRAFGLTDVEIRNFRSKHGNSPAKYIMDKKLGGDTDTILNSIEDIKDTNYKGVRETVSQVETTYSPNSVPRIKQSLDIIESDVDVPGLENLKNEVTALKNKENYTLSDVQRVKELIDETQSIYSRAGDVSGSAKAKGLANMRDELKTFIENEAKPYGDVEAMNKEVSSAREMEDMILKNAEKGLNRASVGLTDMILIGSAGTGVGILPAAGILLVKKLIESPTLRIKFAATLNKVDKSQLVKMAREIKSGKTSPRTQKIIMDALNTVQKTSPALVGVERVSDEK